MRNTLTSILLFFAIIYSCQEDKTPVTAQDIYELQQQISEGAIDTSYAYIRRADSLIQLTAAPDSLKAENNFLKGLYFNSISELDSAAVYFHNAIYLVPDSIYKERQADYFRFAWDAYYSLQLYGDCLTVSQKFKSLLDPEKDFRSLSWAFHWDNRAYTALGDYIKAGAVIDQLVNLTRENDTANIPYVLTTQAQFKYRYLKDKSGAMKILEELLEDEYNLSYNYQTSINTNYGIYQYYAGNYSKALFHYLKALEASKKNTGDKNFINKLVNSYSNIAEVQIDLNDHNAARQYLDSAKALGIDKISKSKQKAILDYELRLAMETNKGSKTITDLVNQIYAHQDSVYTRKTKKELLALNKANENEKILLAEKQASEIENLKLQLGLLILGILALLLTVIGILYYRQRKLKYETSSLQMQQRLLRSQMNPHFTFNTLSAIQDHFKQDKVGASSYLVKFSRLLRLILENSTRNYVPLESELEAIEKFMDLQLIRFPNLFTYDIERVNLERDDLVFIPPMLLQPFIENSIAHGFSGINRKGEISIKLELKEEFISCIIEDNGKGISNSGEIRKNTTSTRLISDFLRKATGKSILITNKRDEQGVVVSFLIPFKTTEND